MKIGPNEISTGTPTERGRYLVFIRCASFQVQDWVEPTIANWTGDRWASAYIGQGRFVGYVGPIVPMKVDAICADAPSVYDL